MPFPRVPALVLLGLCSTAQAQQSLEETRVNLSLTIEQAKLVVETLGQISCQTVAQLQGCDVAKVLLRDIQRQVRDQQK